MSFLVNPFIFGDGTPEGGDGVIDDHLTVLNTAFSSSSYALKGNILTMKDDRWLTSLVYDVSQFASQTIDLFVARLSNADPGTIAEILVDIGEVRVTNPANGRIFSVPGGGTHLENGQIYFFGWVRAGGSGTNPLRIDFPNNSSFRFSPYFSYNGAARVALNSPSVGSDLYFAENTVVRMRLVTEGYVPGSP